MKKLFLAIAFFAFLAFTGVVFAQTQNLVYPIAELGYCRDAKECYLYCEIPQNKASCWSYGKYKLSLSSTSRVLGQDTSSDEEEARRLGITFPIAELGNCLNVSACKAYCDNPSNQEACMDFASKKGLGEYKGHQQMMDELGCRSQEECRSLCENPANQDKCMAVAQKHMTGEMKAQMDQFLSRAREVLGCDSMSSCISFCQNPVNQEKCMMFGSENMPADQRARFEEEQGRFTEQLRQGGVPCDSFESCKSYCSDPANSAKCQFSGEGGNYQYNIHREENFTCSTEEECTNWCKQNPDKCPGFPEGSFEQQSGGVYDSGNVIRLDQGQQNFQQGDFSQQYQQYQQYNPSEYQNYQNYYQERENRSYNQSSTPQPTPLTTPEETSRF